jgi:hypothetical protein
MLGGAAPNSMGQRHKAGRTHLSRRRSPLWPIENNGLRCRTYQHVRRDDLGAAIPSSRVFSPTRHQSARMCAAPEAHNSVPDRAAGTAGRVRFKSAFGNARPRRRRYAGTMDVVTGRIYSGRMSVTFGVDESASDHCYRVPLTGTPGHGFRPLAAQFLSAHSAMQSAATAATRARRHVATPSAWQRFA